MFERRANQVQAILLNPFGYNNIKVVEVAIQAQTTCFASPVCVVSPHACCPMHRANDAFAWIIPHVIGISSEENEFMSNLSAFCCVRVKCMNSTAWQGGCVDSHFK